MSFLSQLNKKHMQVLAHISWDTTFDDGSSHWYLENELGSLAEFRDEWNGFLLVLNKAGVKLLDSKDTLVLDQGDVNRVLTIEKSNDAIITEHALFNTKWWRRKIWNWKIPLKIKCFLCLCLVNKILTWGNILKGGFIGPGICFLC